MSVDGRGFVDYRWTSDWTGWTQGSERGVGVGKVRRCRTMCF